MQPSVSTQRRKAAEKEISREPREPRESFLPRLAKRGEARGEESNLFQTEHVGRAAFEPFQQVFQSCERDILLGHFHAVQ